MFAAAIITPMGVTLYYTGRAGAGYLSSDISEAFFAYTEGHAMSKAEWMCRWRNAGLCSVHTPLAVSQDQVL